MKQIILMLAFIAFFAGQSKAYEYSLYSTEGYKWKEYSCYKTHIHYTLSIDVVTISGEDDIYGFAGIRINITDGKGLYKQIECKPDKSWMSRTISGTFYAPAGAKLSRVKLMASGERYGGEHGISAVGRAEVSW